MTEEYLETLARANNVAQAAMSSSGEVRRAAGKELSRLVEIAKAWAQGCREYERLAAEAGAKCDETNGAINELVQFLSPPVMLPLGATPKLALDAIRAARADAQKRSKFSDLLMGPPEKTFADTLVNAVKDGTLSADEAAAKFDEWARSDG